MKSRMVQSHKFKFVARLKARMGIYEKFGSFFLGYCSHHKSYFLDREHTNGSIRCPICNKNWLKDVMKRNSQEMVKWGNLGR